MKQVLVRSGAIVVEDVPAPAPARGEILVRVSHSCVSAGTELAGLRTSALPLYRRALKQPENVRKVFEMVRDQGLERTLKRVTGKLSAGSPTGYSATGEVISVGSDVEGFAPGDLVACAGAGIANHAELINVPVNLAVHVPDGVDPRDASTVTLGAIAMQGVRRCQPTLGETVVVIGLGLLGQMTLQILRASGCRVIGVDVNARRIEIARELGLAIGLDPADGNWVAQVHRLTDSLGADAAIITASSSSEQVISEAMRCCRRKGRVVVVGDVNLQIERSDIYAKELDLFISTSYGPGRYDPMYEEGGQDYPIAYVRWTENRNMQAYLQMIADGTMRLQPLLAGVFEIDRAAAAYEALKSQDRMIAVISYPERSGAIRSRVDLRASAVRGESRVAVALVGAGSFAQGMHLPNIARLRSDFSLRAVVSRTGANAKAIATQYEAAYATTSIEEVLADPDVHLVLIATRHDQHASAVLAALRAGKHVFVEKPLAIDDSQLDAIEQYFRLPEAQGRVLMTGFNRRFSPAIQRVRELTRARSGPLMITYRMNAGHIPPEHWVHGPEGGGRNIGEACHIYDLFNALVGAPVTEVKAVAAHSRSGHWLSNDNFSASVGFADGSVACLVYTAMGGREHPKEQMEVFCDGRVIRMDDFKSLDVAGTSARNWSSRSSEKGQFEELQALARALRSGGEWPISLADQLSATRVSFEVERQIRRAYAATARS